MEISRIRKSNRFPNVTRLIKVAEYSILRNVVFQKKSKNQGSHLGKIINYDKNSLHNLQPNKLNRNFKQRGHDYELRLVKTERFKNAFVKRYPFNFI